MGTPPGGPVHVRYPLNILGMKGVSQTIYPQSRFMVPVEMRPKRHSQIRPNTTNIATSQNRCSPL